MKGMDSAAVISLSCPAVSNAIWRDSITQGPAIRKNGCSSPTSKPHSCMNMLLVLHFPERHRQTMPLLAKRAALLSIASGLLVLGLGFESCLDVTDEQRMSITRCRSELRVELHTHKPWMVRQLQEFRRIFCRCTSAGDHAGIFQTLGRDMVDFIAGTMALIDFIAINRIGSCARSDRATLCTFTHGTAQVGLSITTLDFAFAVLP